MSVVRKLLCGIAWLGGAAGVHRAFKHLFRNRPQSFPNTNDSGSEVFDHHFNRFKFAVGSISCQAIAFERISSATCSSVASVSSGDMLDEIIAISANGKPVRRRSSHASLPGFDRRENQSASMSENSTSISSKNFSSTLLFASESKARRGVQPCFLDCAIISPTVAG